MASFFVVKWEQLSKYDWEKNGKKEYDALVNALEKNLGLYDKEQKRIQELAKEELKKLVFHVEYVERPWAPHFAANALAETKKAKMTLRDFAAEAKTLQKEFEAAHLDLIESPTNPGKITAEYQEKLKKLRVAVRTRSRIVDAALEKLITDYTVRGGALSMRIKVGIQKLQGMQLDSEKVKKKVNEYAKKIDSMASMALKNGQFLLESCKKIDAQLTIPLGKREKEWPKKVYDHLSDLVAQLATYKSSAKTARELLFAVKNISDGDQHGHEYKDIKIDKIEAARDSLQKALNTTSQNVDKAKKEKIDSGQKKVVDKWPAFKPQIK